MPLGWVSTCTGTAAVKITPQAALHHAALPTRIQLIVAERSKDWFRQAEADLQHARNARAAGDYDWAAFASHQAAEKAIKAVFQKLHQDAWGHVLSFLLAALPDAQRPDRALIDRAKQLDKHYIPTRYPNGFERGAPTDLYTLQEADEAIANAETIIEFCRGQIG